MLTLDDPRRPLDPAVLGAPGGFAWWYADALDAEGNGLVCIASWGLPFLPGERAARLAGRPARPFDRPSLNLALYRRGRQAFYTLHVPARAEATDRVWTFGDTVLELRDTGGERALHVAVDLPVPGSRERLVGDVVVRGPAALPPAEAAGGSPHLWTPVTGPSRCVADLRLGGRTALRLDASGYHDRNASPVALDALGLDHWTWGRQVLGDELVVHYLCWPDTPGAAPLHHLVRVGPDGVVRAARAEAVLEGPRRTAFGMRWWERVRVTADGETLEVKYDPPVDRGPFYLRCTTRARFRGHTARGWAELCHPDRVDLARHRWLVSMCVDREAGRTSCWLPLFVGPTEDRVVRLLRRWSGT